MEVSGFDGSFIGDNYAGFVEVYVESEIGIFIPLFDEVFDAYFFYYC